MDGFGDRKKCQPPLVETDAKVSLSDRKSPAVAIVDFTDDRENKDATDSISNPQLEKTADGKNGNICQWKGSSALASY